MKGLHSMKLKNLKPPPFFNFHTTAESFNHGHQNSGKPLIRGHFSNTVLTFYFWIWKLAEKFSLTKHSTKVGFYSIKLKKCLRSNTVLPRLVRMRAIEEMSFFLIKKPSNFEQFLEIFEQRNLDLKYLAMTLIEYLYLPKSIQKINSGVLF